MITIDGISGAWNYTIGPVHIYRGLESLNEINFGSRPVVVVAKYIPLTELGRIEFTRVLGFVIEEGGPGDPSMIIYSNQHRATVLQAAGALGTAKEGERVVVDGVNAKVFFEPDEETLAKYEELRRQGPPPEPPGMIQKLMKVATDFKSLDPNALKADIFDFQQLGGVMDGIMAIWRKEPLSREQRAELEKYAKGKPIEKSVHENIARYDKWIAENPPAGAGAEDAKGGARKGRAEEAREREREAAAEAREARGRDAKEERGREAREERGRGRAAESPAKAEEAPRPEQPEPAPASAAAGGGEASKDAPKDAAAARRAQREAEIEAARKARRGDKKE
jgi:hypothetical protein